MYTSSDLNWVKNVKREQGNGWAYMDAIVGGSFFLNWPKRKKGNVLKAICGELILIFQTINKGLEYPKGTYLTHIVTPLDNKIEVRDSTHPFCRLVGVIAMAYIPKPIELNFFKPNRGACCNINLIERTNKLPISELELKRKIWNLFNPDAELKDLFEFVINDNFEIEIDGSIEGEEKVKMKEHKYYERDPQIIQAKKKEAIKSNILFCEVCNFDFKLRYGNHGNGFIECHHKSPIAKAGKRLTKLNDLALVCSNCHRMLHRKNAKNNYFTINELKEIIVKN
ncbi:MAG: hypothetical protein JWP37_382 [Mucilaginibacter sp.]|nr:hypothetical protein [Mucilaginibacter sp.]